MQSVCKLYMAQYLSKWWLQNQVMRSSRGKGQINQQDNALSHEWWFTDLHLKADHQLVTNRKQTQLLSSHMQDWPLCHLNESESNCRGDIHTLSIALIGSCMITQVFMLQSSLQGLLPWLVFTTKITCNMPHHCTAIKMCLYRMKDTSAASRNTLMASIPEHCKIIFKEIKESSCESTSNQAAGSS
jgi:hypothetical protein